MDLFEEKMKALKDMAPENQMQVVGKLKERCPCPTCPSYTGCAKNAGETLFCTTGKSFMCISEEKGCSCPTCPIAKEMGLKYQFFCTRGSEKAQRYENTIWGTKMI
ncbi:MAG: DUF2769 domain-containing protein [Methanomicrobiales archaeon]|nr:DUF2769 domain-containing protein [Methanomicrobiales archaeon]